MFGDFRAGWDILEEQTGSSGGALAAAVSGAVLSPFYALGGYVNQATGGETPTYNPLVAAYSQTVQPPTYSDFTQAVSGYQGSGPDDGFWGIPILNPKTVEVAKEVVDEVLPPWALPVALGVGGIALFAALG